MRGDRGQAAIEFTGMIPVILVTLALMWEAALIGYAFSVAGDAADEAAHAAAVGGNCQAAAQRAAPAAFHVMPRCNPGGTMATADVKIGVPVLFPGFTLPIDVTGYGAAVREDQHAGS
ncbi:pilus assembly protein [Streptomyces bomunensis]|uniref:Pilus assembly protein n=1 Tax=Streptomyces montanisoli TaxID=2798581 RepID=A0A940MD97_9ACTN|nr:pilus assembly protein [Streptomyces montanisoli]